MTDATTERPVRQAVPADPVSWAGMALDGAPASIPDARRFATDFVARLYGERDLPVSPAVTGTVQLVVSELVTNACKYAPGPSALHLELAGSDLEITVWDTSPALPLARAAEPGRVGQHGLEIVTALCEGLTMQRQPIGKRITARVPALPAAGSAPGRF
ncbi:ATP-binding protein [Streptomyces sp. HMX112]|uniref:ATP-binding protein n=1 Tax=Streptomyces sp. HMX112 TaxID=3390850 RepID=UPI003A8092E2